MLLSGVRSSWLMLARNSDLYLEVNDSSVAFSSSARRACSISWFLASTSTLRSASCWAFCSSSSLVCCSSLCCDCNSVASCWDCVSSASVCIVASMLFKTIGQGGGWRWVQLRLVPDQALHSASFILPAIDMPGVTMPGFKELAEVIRRTGIYGPRDYLRIVQEQIRYWKIESLQGLGELGRMAQEKIMGIPARLKRIAEHMETRSRAKTFRFEVVFNREFAME